MNSLAWLKPGGVAVHTAEFNLSSNFSTIEAHDLVLFRKFDMEALELLRRSGELTGWSIASYRQNYAKRLSTFLSARELENIGERLRQVQAQRAVVGAARSANAAAGAPLNAVAVTLRSLATLTPRPIEVVLLGVGAMAANNGPFPLRTAPWLAVSTQAAAVSALDASGVRSSSPCRY